MRIRPSAFALEAATKVAVYSFNRAAFEAAATDFPDFGRWLTGRYLDELDATREWMSLLGHRGVTERLASFLLILHWRLGTNADVAAQTLGGPVVIEVPISRNDVALCLRTTKESVSRSVQSMVREGIIEALDASTYRIPNPRRLVEASGDDDLRLMVGGPAHGRH